MPNDPSPLRARLAGELDALRRQSRFRSLECPPGLNLSSNDYLGLAADPRLREAAARAVRDSSRVGSTGSRLLAGNSPDWEQAEEEFAGFAGSEAALFFSSGYAANLGLLAALLRPGDVVYSDSLNHASLIDGMRLSGARKVIYPHGDLGRLEEALALEPAGGLVKLIVTESVFSMEGDRAPVAALAEMARRYGAELVLDEAHATGVFGPGGRGLAAEMGLEGRILAAVHTCGKALASAGAFVCSNLLLKQYLVNRARTFIYSTASPPYLAHQIRAAIALAQDANDRRAHLAELARALREGLRGEGFDAGRSQSQIVPLIVGSDEAALAFAALLREDGFAVRAIRPPTVPNGQARLRLSLTASLAAADIERLLRACIRSRDRIGRQAPVGSPHAG